MTRRDILDVGNRTLRDILEVDNGLLKDEPFGQIYLLQCCLLTKAVYNSAAAGLVYQTQACFTNH